MPANRCGPGRRSLRTAARAACLALSATLLGLVAAPAAPAAADVVVTPNQARQGDGIRLLVRVTNDHRTAALTGVRLELPREAPVAEVYPMSVDDWAPTIIMRKLAEPVPGMHGGQVTEAAEAVQWTAVDGYRVPPGGSTELPISMGPLPQVDRLLFSLVQTYADGSQTRTDPARDAVVLQLTAGDPAARGGHGHGTPAAPPAAEPAGPAEPGTSRVWSLAGWAVAALAVAVAVGTVLRSRRRPGAPETADGTPDAGGDGPPAGRQPVADGADGENRPASSRWSYR